jgi:hypothetical protein
MFGFIHLAIAVLLNTSWLATPRTSVTVFSQYHYNQTHSYDIIGSHRLSMLLAGPQAVGGIMVNVALVE